MTAPATCGARKPCWPVTCQLPAGHDADHDAKDGSETWSGLHTAEVRVALVGDDGAILVSDHWPALLPDFLPLRSEVAARPDGLTFRIDLRLAEALETGLRRVLHGGKSGLGPFCRCHVGQPPREVLPGEFAEARRAGLVDPAVRP